MAEPNSPIDDTNDLSEGYFFGLASQSILGSNVRSEKTGFKKGGQNLFERIVRHSGQIRQIV